MQAGEIEKAVREILAKEHHGIRMPAAFSSEESLFLKGIIDSFGVFPFVKALEDRFEIKVRKSDVHPGNLETIKNIISFIQTKMEKGN